jgi:signal transduction protein with GAF and PtsI domain
MGTDVSSLYLVTTRGRELLLTATNGLNESMVGKVVMKVGEGITRLGRRHAPARGGGGRQQRTSLEVGPRPR